MAKGQVAARLKGDIYQAMMFWYFASPILDTNSLIKRVAIEHDAVSGADDLAIFYEPALNAGSFNCDADYFQIKYHVDRSKVYSSKTFCDPKFIRSKKSILQKLFAAHKSALTAGQNHRLHYLSNWKWDQSDLLFSAIREDEGELASSFFQESERSKIGQLRESWRTHLGVARDPFTKFATRLRLRMDFFGRRPMREALDDRLTRYGLKPGNKKQLSDQYVGLYNQIIAEGVTDFTPESFRSLCMTEGLLQYGGLARESCIGIRSFMRFAERMEDECSGLVSVAHHFDGRHIKDFRLWSDKVAPEVIDFLSKPILRERDFRLLLDCHSTLAFLAGYVLDLKSGAKISPHQKGLMPSTWKPEGRPSKIAWVKKKLGSRRSDETVIAISVTHDVLRDVQKHIHSNGIVANILHLALPDGCGPNVLKTADEAVLLAASLAKIIRECHTGKECIRLFVSAPNGFLFFLGKHREGLGSVQLHEFDFDATGKDDPYKASLSFPLGQLKEKKK